jgi:predicted N-acyltransferase
MRQICQFWHVVVYDDVGHPAACACLTAMTIDLADIAGIAAPRVASAIRRVPETLSRYRKLKTLICGLPGAPSEKSLALASTDSAPQILAILDGAISKLAAHVGTDVIAYRQFGKGDLSLVNRLLDFDYLRIPIHPTYYFSPSFQDFAHYCAALNARYRKHIKRSMRKLEDAGIKVSILTDPEEIVKVYTSDIHALYYQMAARAEVNIELLPIEFFHQLTLHLRGEVELLVLCKDSVIVAIGWCIHAGSAYYMLYAGLDYRLNSDFDLYFNLMYAALDRALRKGVSKIHVGQGGTAFKVRLGCYPEPLYGFIKGHGPLMSRLIRYGSKFLLAEMPTHPASSIFKKGQ